MIRDIARALATFWSLAISIFLVLIAAAFVIDRSERRYWANVHAAQREAFDKLKRG